MTLIELLVTIAVMGVVLTALSTLIVSFYRDNGYLIGETAALNNARNGLTDAITTLREASYGDDGTYPIASAATSSVTVYADLDDDGTTEKVSYFISGTTLYRTVTEPTGNPPAYPSQPTATSTLATNVRNTSATPLFTYYDDTGAQLATSSPTLSAISSIQVQLLVDLDPLRAPAVFTLLERATLRNLQKH